MSESAFGVDHDVSKAGWDHNKHPRGGNKDNPGQFSSGWGPKARKQNAGIYLKRAEALHADARKRGDKKAQKKYRYMVLEQRRIANNDLSGSLRMELERRSKDMIMGDERAKAYYLASVAAGGVTYLGAAYGNSSAMMAGAATAVPLATAAARRGTASERDELGITGFRRDGTLSDEEAVAVNSLLAVAMVSAGVAMDAKMHTGIGKITSAKLAQRLGKTKVTRDLRVSDTGSTAKWNDLMRGGQHGWMRRSRQRGTEAQTDLEFDIASRATIDKHERLRAFRLDHAGYTTRTPQMLDAMYYGNPFQGGRARTYHLQAAKHLDIDEPLVAHYRLGGTTPAPLAQGIGKYIEITYDQTQKLLKEMGITYVDVTRGMAVNKSTVRNLRLPNGVDGSQPVWVRGDIRLQPLNSFATKPDMAIDYALNNVGGFGQWGSGNLAVIVRARVPAERVYSFAGFGPGHGSEIVLKGGWLNDVEILVVDPTKAFGTTQRLTGTLGRTTGRTNQTMARMQELWDSNLGIAKRDYSRAAEKWRTRERRADLVENTGQTVAGGAGAVIGGAALRDAALKDHPKKVHRTVAKLPKKLRPVALHGKPGFKVLATVAGGTVTAAAGTRSRKLAEKKARRYEAMSKSDEPGSMMHRADLAKAFDNHPKMTGRTVTVYEQRGSTSTTHAPDTMSVKRTGKTLVLRRPKYQYQAYPNIKSAKKGSEYYAGLSGKTTPDKDTRRKVARLVESGKKSGRVKNLKVDVEKQAANMPNAELARRKKVQSATTIAGSTLGLSALGALGGAKLLPKATKLGKTPRGQKYAQHLDRAATQLSIGAGGVGGVGGYNFASIQRAEAKKVEPHTKKKAKRL